MDAKDVRMGFLGFGNMARAIARGLVEQGGFKGASMCATALHLDKLEETCAQFGAKALPTAADVVESSDIVIVAVKPDVVRKVVEPVADMLSDKVLLSIASGCTYSFYEELLPKDTHHLSFIPNTPVAIGEGVLACETTHSLECDELTAFEQIFGSIGMIEWIDSSKLSVASALAGCGPALAAMFIEAYADGGVKHGLARDLSYRLVAQMMVGTAGLCLESGQHPGAMKDAVCSPGGTTIRGVASLERDGFRGSLIDAVDAIVEG